MEVKQKKRRWSDEEKRSICFQTMVAAQAEQVLAEDPFSGHLFVFRGRRGDLLKIIWWGSQGACLFPSGSNVDGLCGPP